jgi:hypothetical protein
MNANAAWTMKESKRTGRLRKSCQFEVGCRHRYDSADAQRVLAIHLAPLGADSCRVFSQYQTDFASPHWRIRRVKPRVTRGRESTNADSS